VENAADAAFREWYEASLPRVHRYLYNRCGRRVDLAEELTQETFLEAVRSRSFDEQRDRVGWLIGIARHRLLDHYRREARRERTLVRLIQGRPLVAITLDRPDEDARLADALERLPANQRAAVVLRYVDDLAVREVARLLGRTESATESLLSRGRETLRRVLSEES
jgi:RNA polymerase sigma-70 factor (ECF subfamily)